MQTFDGLGRTLGVASNHPGSTGGYKSQIYNYDLMGRVKKFSNPAEITNAGVPTGDDAAVGSTRNRLTIGKHARSSPRIQTQAPIKQTTVVAVAPVAP